MESGLMSLPLDLFHMILDETLILLGTKKALRLRLVNKQLATEILYIVCKPGSLNVTKEDIFDRYWELQSMSKVFSVGFLLPRLNLGYAVQSHFLSSILQAEELLMEQYPDHTRKQRDEFRYALCAAETWSYTNVFSGDVLLGDIEPIFPQNKPPVDGRSPLADALSAAAYMGHIYLVQKLLDKGADPNFVTGYFRPSLQQAASRGHNDILLLLLSKGADIDLGYWRPRGSRGCGALYLASLHGHERTVELLLDCKYKLQPGLLMSGEVSFLALRGGHLKLAKKYMATQISTDIKNESRAGLIMLRDAVYYDHEHTVRWLLQNGVDITKNNPHAWEMSPTLLEIAALHGRPSIIRLLLEYNANRHSPALANAAQNGHIEVAKLLLDTASEDIDIWSMLRGKKPFRNRSFKRYETPLLLAVCNGEVEMVRFLLGRGIDKHFPVSQAAARGEEEILRLLLEAQAKYNIERDYTELLTWVRKQSHIPKRISNVFLELSPITRAIAKIAPSGSAE